MALTDRYDALLTIGRPVFLLEGEDYWQPVEWVKSRLRAAAKRRGLQLTTRELYDPPGLLYQTYINPRYVPRLDHLQPTSRISKKSHKHLYCGENGCDNRLRPAADSGKCDEHSS